MVSLSSALLFRKMVCGTSPSLIVLGQFLLEIVDLV